MRALEWQRDATGRDDPHERSKRDDGDEYRGLAECLLFGRAVDRLYLRSGLSCWCRARSEWQRGTRHVEDSPRHTAEQPPLLTGEFTIARCSSFIERLTYIAKFAENARRASLTVVDTLDRDLERLLRGRKHANVDDEPIISVKGSRSSWTNYSDENTRSRERNLIYFRI